MALGTGLRLISVAGMVVVLGVGVLVLQTRHSGQMRVTAGEKALVLLAGGLAVAAAGVALSV